VLASRRIHSRQAIPWLKDWVPLCLRVRPSAQELIWFQFVGGSVIDKATVVELFVAGFFGIASFWAPNRSNAGNNALFAWIARLSLRVDLLRRSRWQWLTVIGTMLGLRMQHQLPPALELMVGLTFLILLAFPLRQMIRARR
jgi:hypothetical protein